ncbi:MAG: PAS domain S-box protein, partial [Rhodospirillaceae bacterium]|nr:PAS domain S-box protein [Rhodospirillaceae bacterium]
KLGGGSYSFTAALFHGSDGNPAGHFFVVEAAPIAWEPQVWDFLKLVAERVGAEFTLRDGFADATWMDSLIDDTGTALVVTDTSGLILLANDTYANWAGFESSADVVGSNMEQWIHRDALSKNSMSVSKLLRNGVVDKYESVLVNRDGVQREVSVVATVDRTPAGTRLKALMRDIHRRKNAERARHESESRFRNLIEGSLEGILVADSNKQAIFVNAKAAQIFGYDSVEDMMAIDSIERIIAPHELPRIREWRRRILSGEETNIEQEYQACRKDGTLTWVHAMARLVEWDGQPMVQSTMLDVTERRTATVAKAEVDARLNGIIDNAPFSILLKDIDGRYVLVNREAEKWLGKSFEDIAGKLPADIHPEESGARERKYDLEVLNEGHPVSYEFDRVGDDTRTFWATKFPILSYDGRTTGVGSIISDITERKRSEEILQQQMARAEESSDAKTRFLAAASHDLRQPLHSMELMLEILARQSLDPGQQELVSDIAQAANIAGGLLNPLLDFSRLEAGMVEPEFVEFPVAALLSDMEVGFRPQAEEAGLNLTLVPCSATIRSDRVLLSRIVSNLLSNAIRYTETGRVLIGCRRQQEVLRIEIWDTGAGIEARHLNVIFEEFQQIETFGRDRDKGLGLGLAIVNAQAALLGHEVRVSSQPGRGSCFTIEVPLCARVAATAPEMIGDMAAPEALTGLRMLILEDNFAIRRATKMLLERWGCEVATAASRAEAMDVIDRETSKFDLIIADYHLEDGDNGVDTVVQMKDMLKYEVSAIIVTADISNESLEHAAENEFPLLQKPFRPAALRSAISQSIQAHPH